jgi:hypothetical protein
LYANPKNNQETNTEPGIKKFVDKFIKKTIKAHFLSFLNNGGKNPNSNIVQLNPIAEFLISPF